MSNALLPTLPRAMPPRVTPRDAANEPLRTYAYSYPHKSSYRRLDPPVAIADAWAAESGTATVYVHVPFCEMRCGFCNLFTAARPEADLVSRYLDALARQSAVVRRAAHHIEGNTLALGGGTPTLLDAKSLDRLFGVIIKPWFRSPPSDISVEASPKTATPERLDVLREHQVTRISLGVQSFVPAEAASLGRPQSSGEVEAALQAIRDRAFPQLNIDLIYGDPTQTIASWRESLRQALSWQPEEVYLYPLYIRPGTGLGQREAAVAPQWHRATLYAEGRDRLLAAGYRQASLRCFTRVDGGGEFQGGNTIGLGCGSRSYTRGLHYSSRFATSRRGVRAILGTWIEQSENDFALATHGRRMSADDRLRRETLLGLMDADGLDLESATTRFAEELGRHAGLQATLRRFLQQGLATRSGGRLRLTESGLERSDELAVLLYSEAALSDLAAFTTRESATGELA